MKQSWWVFDRVLLDGIFQPAANYLHEKTGLRRTPARVCAFGGLALFLIAYYQKHGFAADKDIIAAVVGPAFCIFAAFSPERLSSEGSNLKRWSLYPARAGIFLIFLYAALIVIIRMDPIYDWFENLMVSQFNYYVLLPASVPTTFEELGIFLMWACVCFLSVGNPPPRRLHARNRAFATG